MDKWLVKLEKEYGDLYKEIFNELSKLQIEEKFLERQAQTLIEKIRKSSSFEIQNKLAELLESSDPDFLLQSDYSNHLESIGQITSSSRIKNILAEEFGSTDAEAYVYK